MAAFIDEVIHILHINTFVLYASIENVAFCMPCFFNSGDDVASFLELVEFEYVLSSLSVFFDPAAPV